MADAGKARVLPGDSGRGNPVSGSFVLALLMVTLAAVAAGGVFGLQLHALSEETLRRDAEADETGAAEVKPIFNEPATIRSLPAIVTNLAGPQNAWVRMEASIVLAGEPASGDDLLATKIAEDIVVFLRTVSLSEIEGASGFEHLRADLSDRVRVRSDGRARELVIHTFLIE